MLRSSSDNGGGSVAGFGRDTMKKQPEITDATRKAILDAFWAVYQTTPIDKITVKDITDAAHVHRSTFYRYFTDLYEVLNCLEQMVLSQIVLTLQTKVRAKQMCDLLAHSDVMISTLKDYAPLVCHLTGPAGDPNFRSRLRSQMRQIYQQFIPPTTSLDADYLFDFVFHTILFNLSFWYENQARCTLEEVGVLSRRLISSGLGEYVAQLSKE